MAFSSRTRTRPTEDIACSPSIIGLYVLTCWHLAREWTQKSIHPDVWLTTSDIGYKQRVILPMTLVVLVQQSVRCVCPCVRTINFELSSTHCVSKNDTDVARNNYDIHEGILIIFSRYVTKKRINIHSTQLNCYSAKHPSSFLSGQWSKNGPELNSNDNEIYGATQQQQHKLY